MQSNDYSNDEQAYRYDTQPIPIYTMITSSNTKQIYRIACSPTETG